MTINNKFSIGQRVFLATDPEQSERIVTAIIVGPYDLLYTLNLGTEQSNHYDIEITASKDYGLGILN